jgi:hypothetical protein
MFQRVIHRQTDGRTNSQTEGQTNMLTTRKWTDGQKDEKTVTVSQSVTHTDREI